MFPNLKSKKFTDITTNKTVTVIDQFENIAILDNTQRVDVARLLDRGYFDEHIDPANFFGEKNYQIFAEKIKNIPSETLQNIKDDDSPIITSYDPEEERRALLEKAKNMDNPMNALKGQMDKFKDYLDDEAPSIPETVITPTQVNTPTQKDMQHHIMEHQASSMPSTTDPIVGIFKNVKRNNDFKISIDVENKIPRPDFIEMMEDSYEISIIDFLANEFTQNILKNPDIIKNKIKEEINKIVYKSNTQPSNDINPDGNKEVNIKEKKITKKKEPKLLDESTGA